MTDSSDLDEVTLHQVTLGENVVIDSKAGIETIEREDAWIWGNVHWDEGDQELFGQVDFVGYRALFDYAGDDGLTLCTDDAEWSACSDLDRIESHGVYVKFLGEEWVISDVEDIQNGFVDSSAVDKNEIYTVDGARVKLAKESVSGIINVGEIMEAPSGYKVRLDDISRETGMSNEHPAIITVLDANDNEICREQVSPGETKDDLCDVTTGVRLHVYQTAPGLNFIAKWAEMAIYKDEIELESGNEFMDDQDTEWEVTLGWSNEDVTKNDPEYLREIVLSNSNLDETEDMEEEDSLIITDVEGYDVYELTYNGIDTEGVKYDKLSFEVEEDKDFDIVYNTLGDECDVEDANGVEITTNDEFRYGGKRGDAMWYIPAGEADITNCTPYLTGADMIVLSTDEGNFAFELAGPAAVDYRWAGSQGYIDFYPTGGWDYMALVENAGKYGNLDMVDALGFAYDVANQELAEEYISVIPDEDYIGYVTGNEDLVDASGLIDNGIVAPFDTFNENGYTSFDRYEEGFISMRGTEFSSGSDSAYEFKVPNEVMKTSWTFSSLRDTSSIDGGNIYILHEGDEQVIGTSGVQVKVLSIDQELTPCVLGTGIGEAPSCTPDMSGVEAVIMPMNVPEIENVSPYRITENLVYLDSDNVALDTGIIITVGGDAVNSISRDVLEQEGLDLEASNIVVTQIGNKIIVAGLSAADTMEATQQFLSELE